MVNREQAPSEGHEVGAPAVRLAGVGRAQDGAALLPQRLRLHLRLLAEALRASRMQNYSAAIEEEFAFGEHLNAREERAVRKTVSGLLKILHHHGEWTRAELREYLELALEGRRRIKEQLKNRHFRDLSLLQFVTQAA